jgi:hypothetical protein
MSCDDNGNEGEIGEGGVGGAILVNLASEEYSSAVDAASLPRGTTYLHVVFRHAGRVVSVHAKRARGCMAARTLRDVSEFDREGYRCAEFANGKMWEEEGEKRGECENDDVKIVRMIFDRPSGAIKSDAAKRAAPVTTKRQGNAAKKTKK